MANLFLGRSSRVVSTRRSVNYRSGMGSRRSMAAPRRPGPSARRGIGPAMARAYVPPPRPTTQLSIQRKMSISPRTTSLSRTASRSRMRPVVRRTEPRLPYPVTGQLMRTEPSMVEQLAMELVMPDDFVQELPPVEEPQEDTPFEEDDPDEEDVVVYEEDFPLSRKLKVPWWTTDDELEEEVLDEEE